MIVRRIRLINNYTIDDQKHHQSDRKTLSFTISTEIKKGIKIFQKIYINNEI